MYGNWKTSRHYIKRLRRVWCDVVSHLSIAHQYAFAEHLDRLQSFFSTGCTSLRIAPLHPALRPFCCMLSAVRPSSFGAHSALRCWGSLAQEPLPSYLFVFLCWCLRAVLSRSNYASSLTCYAQLWPLPPCPVLHKQSSVPWKTIASRCPWLSKCRIYALGSYWTL